MKYTNLDKKYMKLAFQLAQKGSNRVYPNPMVGCVIEKDGQVVGKGFHQYFGGPHAETNALEQAKESAKDATLYVTLEPCNHWGKTPPCTQNIVKSGVKRVVFPILDPNPQTTGKGSKSLRQHNIIVNKGIMKEKANEFYKEYIKSFKNNKSHVIAKAAMSLDGKIATHTGDSKWISSEPSRRLVHKLRSQVHGVIVGINTVLKDNPELTSHGKGKNPIRIIIDPNLKIPLNSKVLNQSAPTIIFYNKDNENKLKKLQNKGILLKRVLINSGNINFKLIIKELAKLSIYQVLIEGGGETISSALKSSAINEVFFFIAPKIIGGRGAITPVEGLGIDKISKSIKLESWKIKPIGNDFLIKAKVKH